MGKLDDLIDQHERNALLPDTDLALLLDVIRIYKKNSAADALAREVHFLLNTPLRRVQDAMLRVAAALRAYSSEKEKTIWNDGVPEKSSIGCVICEWENGHAAVANTHHYADGTSAWVPRGALTKEDESMYRGLRVKRWRWSGPAVPIPDGSVRIWRWEDAPGELAALSKHGGDEDWVCLVPKEMQGEYLPFVYALGVCQVSEYSLADGRKVFIGAHA